MATTLGANQPFRYRGYVYDTETGWYYLQSRYYNPEVGRFISSDVYLSTGQGVLGHNAYAYCLNNSVNMADDDGTVPRDVRESVFYEDSCVRNYSSQNSVDFENMGEYATLEEAAMAFGDYVFSSYKDATKHEYATIFFSYINANGQKRYTFTEPWTDNTADSVYGRTVKGVSGYSPEAYGHTHSDIEYDGGDVVSETDIRYVKYSKMHNFVCLVDRTVVAAYYKGESEPVDIVIVTVKGGY